MRREPRIVRYVPPPTEADARAFGYLLGTIFAIVAVTLTAVILIGV